MSIGLYDEALVNKIQKWVKDPSIQILKPDEVTRLFQIKADQGYDKPIQLPLIALSRDREISILNRNKQPKTFDGIVYKADEKYSIPITAVPIELRYQLDIYTKDRAHADEYVRNFVFNFINLPKLKVVLPYMNSNIEHISNIWLDGNIMDNSDISERLFPDQFTRYTIRLVIDDAYLFSMPTKENVRLASIFVQTVSDIEEYRDIVIKIDNGEMSEYDDCEEILFIE